MIVDELLMAVNQHMDCKLIVNGLEMAGNGCN